jgi:hypothetical protein
MILLGSKVSWKAGLLPNHREIMATASDIAKKQGRKPWPHLSSVFIYGDWVIVYM